MNTDGGTMIFNITQFIATFRIINIFFQSRQNIFIKNEEM